jgi:hypothetical protein
VCDFSLSLSLFLLLLMLWLLSGYWTPTYTHSRTHAPTGSAAKLELFLQHKFEACALSVTDSEAQGLGL